MPIVQAWQCPKTKKLFPTENAYKKHLTKLARETYVKRKFDRITNALETRFAKMRRCGSFEEITEWVNKNQELFWINTAHRDRSKTFDPEGFSLEVSFDNMKWSDCVRNTHTAPKGMPTNWERAVSKPLGYPGFSGHIRYKYSTPMGKWMTPNFSGSGIHTGTGSAGGSRGDFGVVLWEQDWPSLAVMEKLLRDD